jgi:NAD(P)-dependent dehydrogenase (short-subunit alcohol dehydrogenase family)
VSQAAGKQIEKWGNGGSIVHYASIAGYNTQRSTPNTFHPWSAYATSKGAVLQLTRSMAVELAKKNIRVNSISPGQIWTAMSGQYLDGNPAVRL